VPPFDMVKVQKMPGNLQIMIFVNNVHSHSINIELSYNLLWSVLYRCIWYNFQRFFQWIIRWYIMNRITNKEYLIDITIKTLETQQPNHPTKVKC
jgi:hypothetical protein